jgi:FKBP-type peptidyl-prolyl cis-trans isomerase FklB
MQLKYIKKIGVAVTIALAFSTAANANEQQTQSSANANEQQTQSSTTLQQPAATVNMQKVSYIMGYGMGKALTAPPHQLKVNTNDMQAGFTAAEQAQAPAKGMSKNNSYVIGYNISNKFKMDKVDIVINQFMTGVKNAIANKASSISKADAKTAMTAFIQEKTHEYEAALKINQAASNKYLAKIQQQSGIKTLSNGLYYKVDQTGSGDKPKATDTVKVEYTGYLPNGTVFDSSKQHGGSATFKLNQVIPGWTQALQQMPVGSTWDVYIAPKLAYGAQAPASIGPNQALHFKISLLEIEQPSS